MIFVVALSKLKPFPVPKESQHFYPLVFTVVDENLSSNQLQFFSRENQLDTIYSFLLLSLLFHLFFFASMSASLH